MSDGYRKQVQVLDDALCLASAAAVGLARMAERFGDPGAEQIEQAALFIAKAGIETGEVLDRLDEKKVGEVFRGN